PRYAPTTERHATWRVPVVVLEKLLLRAAIQPFFNASKLTLGSLSDTQTADDLMSYVQSFSQDAREIFEHFDFMLSNPPFGVEWKKVQKAITSEHSYKGYDGRFGPGLPRVSDGSLLLLMYLVSKMRPRQEGGSRIGIGIILNGSPLFTGGAGSGESEIRRYLRQHDLVEAIVGLPTDMFFNTGIAPHASHGCASWGLLFSGIRIEWLMALIARQQPFSHAAILQGVYPAARAPHQPLLTQ
ncbi:N-6 DNA methylase, partial [Halomonas sp. BM-2019]|uniref:HsdM family class I SAM-dependent methyltransferase n=1 Tax=Halomonas sp. BM-2019 TaxID=2811227 RepID=UPI0031FDA207